jgi:muramoyltetrapeptide carboxypeptidase
MVKPWAVRVGDRVAVVAPSSPFGREAFEAGLAEVRRLGFEPVYDESVFERRAFVAGEASVRAAALRRALDDPSVSAILTVRGGYGSVQILPWLDPDAIRRARKPIVGYSDLTSLLSFVGCACELVSFHGPTVAGRFERGPEKYDERTFIDALTSIEPLGPLPFATRPIRPGEARGRLFGGNLTQLAASLGTPFAFDPPTGCILFIEEVNERPYRLDRLWTQLSLAGIVERAAGIVFGECPGCDEPCGEPTAEATLADLVRDFAGPVLFGFPSGHAPGPAVTLPLGVMAHVTTAPTPAFSLEEAAVERRP